MKFVVDAHLPIGLVHGLLKAGHDALHTSQLALGNRTSDNFLNELTIEEQRVLITKDSDFSSSFLLVGRPYKLLLISTGNISNKGLKDLFLKNHQMLISLLEDHSYVELTADAIVVHR